MPFPSTKIARQARIVELLQTRRVRSQAELAQYLTDDGMLLRPPFPAISLKLEPSASAMRAPV